MFSGKGRSQRCHHIFYPRTKDGDGIHIAFHHNGITGLLNGTVSPVQAKEDAPLVKEHGFRSVQVFGRAVIQHAAAKTNHSSTLIGDGNNNPVAEPVINPAAILPLGCQPVRKQ